MIEPVEQGGKITAEKTNQIIEACNGLLQPAEGDFVTTGKGPLFSRGAAPTSLKQSVVPEQLFHCMNAKTLLMTDRGEGRPEYDASHPKRSWMLKVPQTEQALLKALTDTSPEEVLSVACVTGSSSSLDVHVDDAQLSSCANGWFDTASYDSPYMRVVWMRPESEEAQEGLVVVFTDQPDGSQLEQRVEDVLGAAVKTQHSQRLCGAEPYARDTKLRQQYQVPYVGMPAGISVDSQVSGLQLDDEDAGLSSLQRKVLEYKVSENAKGRLPVYSIFRFDDPEYKSDFSEEDLSSCHIVVRHYDEDNKELVVEYKTLSSMVSGMTTVDSKIEQLYLSSIQDGTYVDGDGNEKEYHQLYGFDGPNTELDRDNLDKFDLVVRDSNTPAHGAQVSYIPISSVLSTADVYTDTQKSQMSSIQYDDDGNGPYLELFKFNQGESEDLAFEDFGRYHMVVRDNEEGHVDYATLSGVASEIVSAAVEKSVDLLSVEVDSEISALMLSSIQTSSWTDPETDEEHRYHQLFNFQLSAKDVDWDLQENYDVVLRDKYEVTDGAIVNYMPLSCLMRRPDSEGDSGQKSTSIISGTQDLQLWKFDEAGQGTASAEVPVWWNPPADALSDEILVRAGGAGGELMYKKLQLRQAKLSVDRGTYGTQKSLQYAEIDGTTFLELNGFHADGETLPAVTLTSADAPLLPADTEFLYRQKDQNGRWQLKYAPLSAKVSVDVPEEISVDTDVLGTQRSLEWAEDDGVRYLQLYGMDDPGQATEQVDLKYAKTGFQHLLPDDEEFVIRTGPGGEIVYKDVAVCLSAYLSGGGGGGGLSVDNVSLSTNADGEACIKGWNVDPKVSVNSQQLTGYGLVARDGNNQLKYLDLSVAQGGGGSALPQPWDMTIENGTATFTNCCARIARAYYFFPDQTLQVGSGDLMIYMQVEHKTAPAVTVAAGYYQYAQSFLSGSYSNCISASVQPLYRVIDGEVACDYRCMMGIQAYDNRAFSQTKPF